MSKKPEERIKELEEQLEERREYALYLEKQLARAALKLLDLDDLRTRGLGGN